MKLEDWTLIAEQACLELSEKEITYLAAEAEQMRELLIKMARVKTPEEIFHHQSSKAQNRLRNDECPAVKDNFNALDASQESEDGFFLIPNVL